MTLNIVVTVYPCYLWGSYLFFLCRDGYRDTWAADRENNTLFNDHNDVEVIRK